MLVTSDVVIILCLPRVPGILPWWEMPWINSGDFGLCLHACSRIILAAPPGLGELKESVVCECVHEVVMGGGLYMVCVWCVCVHRYM